MFDLVHKHKKVVMGILGLIALTFIFWGVEQRVTSGSQETVATVNGMDIPVREFELELERQLDQLRQLFGGNFDPAALDTPESRRALLDTLINQRVVAAEAVASDLTVSDEMLRDTIVSVPAFQGADGRFSRQTYEAVLRTQNPPMTPAQFEARLRYDLTLAQLARAVSEAAIAPRTVSERLAALEAQQRVIAEARLRAEDFLAQAKVEDAEIKAYYEANADALRTPERIKAEYVMLSAEALAAREQVTPKEVRAHWEANYGPKMAEKEAARRKAEAIAERVRKDPESFAEVAKSESQDPGTREAGGDLGFNPRGSFVKPFEEALFAMKEGQVSGVVESEFGFHVIKLTGIRKQDGREERRASHILVTAPADARPFATMRDEIEAELKKARAAQRFAQAADTFSNMVYEQAESLRPVAEEFGLEIQTSGWITRSADQELGALDNPRLVAALFSEDALKQKRNTEAIEVAPATLVAARVAAHEPARQRSLDEVREEIVERLRREKAAELARREGEARLEKLRSGENAGLKWGAEKTVSRREPQGLPPELLRRVVAADAARLPAYVGMPVGDAGYVLVRISKVIQPEPAQPADEARQRVASLLGAAQYQAYVASLRREADVDVNRENLERR